MSAAAMEPSKDTSLQLHRRHRRCLAGRPHGRRKLFIAFAILALLLVLGFYASAYFSGLGTFFTELFPTRLRGSGQGFAYNFGGGIGARFPTLVGYLSASMPLATAIAILAYGLMLLAALLLPETRGRVLDADE